jgi:hypothetical protein
MKIYGTKNLAFTMLVCLTQIAGNALTNQGKKIAELLPKIKLIILQSLKKLGELFYSLGLLSVGAPYLLGRLVVKHSVLLVNRSVQLVKHYLKIVSSVTYARRVQPTELMSMNTVEEVSVSYIPGEERERRREFFEEKGYTPGSVIAAGPQRKIAAESKKEISFDGFSHVNSFLADLGLEDMLSKEL